MSKMTSVFGTKPTKKPRTARSTARSITNAAGAPAFALEKETEYLKTLLTNVLGQTFYVSEEDNVGKTLALHEEMVKLDPEFVSKALPYARNKGYMRSQPVLGLATLAAEEGKNPTPNSIAGTEKAISTARKALKTAREALSENFEAIGAAKADGDSILESLLTQERSELWEKVNTASEELAVARADRASAGSSYFERAVNGVINIPTDLFDFMAVLKSKKGGEGGRLIKRVIGDWLRDNLDEYKVIKYGSEKKGNYSLKDIFKTVHPKGMNEELVKYILDDPKNPADLTKLPQIKAFEDLKKAKTYTEKATAIKEGRLPHEVVTPFIGSDNELWLVLGAQMPIMAFMRNLATLERHGVIAKPEIRAHAEKVFSKESVQRSKIFPFRFIEAQKHISDSWMKKKLEGCVEHAFENIPELEGRVAVFLDRSGSMGGGAGSRMQIGALYAVSLMRKVGTGNGRFLLFDDRLDEITVSDKKSVMGQVEAIHSRGSTSTELPMRKLLNERDKVDTIILIGDEQQNAGYPFVDVFDQYKREVNPNVKLFLINVAHYGGSVMPFGDKNVFHIAGWSEKVLNFIALASKGFDSMAEAIRNDAV
jgi:60 kDa SS-A/Ro ribonucleoprotein